MNRLHLLAVLLFASMIVGCTNTNPKEFKELAAEELRRQDSNKIALESDRTITVTIDRERKVFLNKESIGTAEDAPVLKEKLIQMLEKRKQELDNQPDIPDKDKESMSKTVFVCAPLSFTYGEVVEVIEAIKAAGGSPIGLQSCG